MDIRENQWRFIHDKLREVVLHTLTVAEKAALNQRLAQAIEAVYPDKPVWAVHLSQHWEAAGDIDRALKYAVVAGQYFRRIGSYAQLRTLAQRGLDMLRPTDDVHTRMRIWEFMGDGYRYSDVEKAEAAYQNVLQLCQHHGLALAKTSCLAGLVVIYRDKGDMAQAEYYTDELLTYGYQHNDEKVLMSARSLKARFCIMRGDYAQAQAYYEENLEMAHRVGEKIRAPAELMNLGAVACMQGDFESGRTVFAQAEEEASAIGAIDIVVYSLLNQANLASDFADYNAAKTYFERCIPMIEALGEFSLLAGAYYDRGDLALRLSELDEAAEWYQKSATLARKLQNHRKLCDSLYGLGKTAFLQRNYITARQKIHESLDYAHALNLIPVQILNLSYLARIHLKLGEPRDALTILTEGLVLAYHLENSLEQLEILTAVLEFLIFQERFERAVEIYILARYHPDVPPSNHKMLEEYFEQLKEELPLDSITAPVAHHKTLDLSHTLKVLVTELETNRV